MININEKYIIKSKHSGKALTISSQNNNRGQGIIYRFNQSPNQIFHLKHTGALLEIMNLASNQVLAVENHSPNNGISIIESQDQGRENQKFRFQEVQPNSNEFIIYTFCGKVLDCFEWGKSNGTKVIQWDFNGGDNQKWHLQKISK